MSPREAYQMALDRGLDLVEVSPNAKPPVCKILDIGKFRYEQAKREKEAKKKQRVIEVKEVKLRPHIDVNDFDTKLRQAVKFLSGGDKVKVTIMFRGREMSHPELGTELLDRALAAIGEAGQVEKGAKLEGRNMSMVVAPKTAPKPEKKPKAEKPQEEAEIANTNQEETNNA